MQCAAYIKPYVGRSTWTFRVVSHTWPSLVSGGENHFLHSQQTDVSGASSIRPSCTRSFIAWTPLATTSSSAEACGAIASAEDRTATLSAADCAFSGLSFVFFFFLVFKLALLIRWGQSFMALTTINRLETSGYSIC